ncbi:MAG TPA: DUF2461 domain-containing protein [bacterium]|nr:DUF2461 domain-containing protein [bacterium]
MAATYFSPAFFSFLKDLKAHNTRDWFQANKPRYERDVRDPLLAFIADFAPRLRTISPHFVADPRPSGGSMFRIYRDTRFARDKSPYKTHAAAHFEHERAGSVHAPGFYIHLAPKNVYVGVGIWQPDPDALAKIRGAIVSSPTAWKKAVTAPKFVRRFVVEGETLKRAPQGIDPNHPMIEDLKRKDFTAGVRLTEKDVLSPRFMEQFTDLCRDATPFMKFLTNAVGLPW